MSATSSIEWTDRTWNPIRGCSEISAGCKNCYAMKQAHRFSGPGMPYEGLTELGPNGPRWTGKIRLVEEALAESLRWKKPQRVFVNSMSDLFHEDVPEDFIFRVFQKMGAAFQHTYQILTKRPERMLALMPRLSDRLHAEGRVHLQYWRHVQLGVSVEDQKTADARIPLLLQTPAAKRFVSYEPALGPVDFTNFQIMGHSLDALRGEWCSNKTTCEVSDKGDESLDWVIIGGESGPRARPFNVQWARDVIAQGKAAGVPVFVKQLGKTCRMDRSDAVQPVALGAGWRAENHGAEFGIVSFRDSHGGNLDEWPEDLRVRQFPD